MTEADAQAPSKRRWRFTCFPLAILLALFLYFSFCEAVLADQAMSIEARNAVLGFVSIVTVFGILAMRAPEHEFWRDVS